MFIKIIQRALLLGAAVVGANQAWSATITADPFPTTSTNITGLAVYDATGGARVVANATFAPAAGTSFAVVRYINAAANLTSFNNCTFSDGLQLSLAHSANAVSFIGTASTFNMTAAEAFIVDASTSGITWTTAPVFNGNGWIDVVASDTWTFTTAMNITAPIDIATGKTLTISDGGSGLAITLSGVVSGAGAMKYANASTGSLIFDASPTFTGGFTHSTTAGAVLQLNDGVNFSPNIALAVAANKIAVAAGGSATISGIISGAYSATKTATTGGLTLTGTNTFTGGLTVLGGTVNLGNSAALGTGTAVVTSGTLGVTTSGIVVANAITPTSATFDVGSGITGTFTGVIGAGAASKTGAGTLILSGTNTPTSWTLNGGTVGLSGTGVLGAVATVSSATALNFLSATTVASTILLNAPLTVMSPSGVTGTISGIISGSSNLVKDGLGIISLGGANTYTGGTTLSLGQVTMGVAAALGTGPVTHAPGALLVTNAGAKTVTPSVASTLSVY